MKVKLKGLKFFNDEQKQVIEKFVKFIQKEVPLVDDCVIEFTDDRPYDMTTGVRVTPNVMYILGRDRMLADILRTIAHEWMHEFEHQRLGEKESQITQDIGGPHENLANIMMGILFKRYEKEYSEDKKILYNED
jgi:hypothetical protein